MKKISDDVAEINQLNNSVCEEVSGYVEDIQFEIDSLLSTAKHAKTLERPMDQICNMEFVFDPLIFKQALREQVNI